MAEVLITLGIIGVVAAITIPSLIANFQEKVLVTQIKRSYSELENALKVYAYENDCSNIVCISDINSNTEDATEKLYSTFKGAQFCSDLNKNNKICHSVYFKTNKPTNNGNGETGYAFAFNVPFFVSTSGVAYKVVQYNECPKSFETPRKDADGNFLKDADGNIINDISTNDVCAEIYVDVNGTQKGPNQFGADVYKFYITSQSVKLEQDDLFKKVITTGKLDYTPYQVGSDFKK